MRDVAGTCLIVRMPDDRTPSQCRKLPSPLLILGFTLLELLTVVGIIGILIGLVMPSLSYARFRAKVTTCSNNYRQWGISVNIYAHDDRASRLPAFEIPISIPTAADEGLMPWHVSLQMGTNLAAYGVSVPLWFCPARPQLLKICSDQFQITHPGEAISTIDELTSAWTRAGRGTNRYAVIDHSWFVPRPLRGSATSYPDPKHDLCNNAVGWPVHLEDPSGFSQPILTDSVLGDAMEKSNQVNGFSFGHQYPSFWTRNINLLFVDGHVVTRSRSKLQWQILSPDRKWIIPY